MQNDQAQWSYQPDTDGPTPQETAAVGDEARWSAPLFRHHEKGSGWYLVLILATVIVGGLAYLIARDRWAVIAIVALAVVVAIAAGKRPHDVEYVVTTDGIRVGSRSFSIDDFRSFSVIMDSAGRSIIISPIKRFIPPVTLFYNPEQEEKVVSILSAVLPLEDYHPDAIDRLSRRLRF